MKFTLTINLGNDAIRTGNDVADALQETAINYLSNSDLRKGDSGRVMDKNGNNVGQWEVR